MELLNDAVKFVKNIVTISVTWVKEFFMKYFFKNALLLALAFWFWFGMAGGFWAFWGWAMFWIWVGRNIEAFGTIYSELKEKNDW